MLAPPARRTISRTVAARNPASEKTCPAASRRRSRVSVSTREGVGLKRLPFKPLLKTCVLNIYFNRKANEIGVHVGRKEFPGPGTRTLGGVDDEDLSECRVAPVAAAGGGARPGSRPGRSAEGAP